MSSITVYSAAELLAQFTYVNDEGFLPQSLSLGQMTNKGHEITFSWVESYPTRSYQGATFGVYSDIVEYEAALTAAAAEGLCSALTLSFVDLNRGPSWAFIAFTFQPYATVGNFNSSGNPGGSDTVGLTNGLSAVLRSVSLGTGRFYLVGGSFEWRITWTTAPTSYMFNTTVLRDGVVASRSVAQVGQVAVVATELVNMPIVTPTLGLAGGTFQLTTTFTATGGANVVAEAVRPYLWTCAYQY